LSVTDEGSEMELFVFLELSAPEKNILILNVAEKNILILVEEKKNLIRSFCHIT
jgi:hypothetical protein